MKKIAYILAVLVISIQFFSVESVKAKRNPGDDYRPGYDCFHNGHKYKTVPANMGNVCPAPPESSDSQGNHVPDPTNPNQKHTVEDCVITSAPATLPFAN